ncbi:MAG: hypothetical protein EOO93_27855, partial [Pedobacter sp.]
MKLKHVFILILLISFKTAFAQQILVKGIISDNQLNKPISDATIKVGRQSTRSDINGYFELLSPLIKLKENGIEISHIGYLSSRLIHHPNHFYEVKLLQSPTQLKEVIVGING